MFRIPAERRTAIVIFQVTLYPEPGPQRTRQQSAASRSADQRERVQLDLDRTGARPLVQHDVDLVVFHRRIQVLLDDRAEPVYFVDEKHVAGIEIRQQTGQIPWFVEHRPGGHLEGRPHFVANDIRERRLAESRRPVQHLVVERFAAHQRRLDEHRQVVDDLVLSAERFEFLRADLVLEIEVGLYVPDIFHRFGLTLQR